MLSFRSEVCIGKKVEADMGYGIVRIIGARPKHQAGWQL